MFEGQYSRHVHFHAIMMAQYDQYLCVSRSHPLKAWGAEGVEGHDPSGDIW